MKGMDSGFKALRTLFWVAPFLLGLYHELACAAYSAALLVWLVLHSRKEPILFRGSIASVTVIVLFAGYLLTPLWAVDHGLALWGIAKVLPLVFFALCLMQCTAQQRNDMLCDLPAIGSVMVIISYVLKFVSPLTSFFVISDRLGGFFQYPNTFASFLLLGMIVVFFDRRLCLIASAVEIMILAFAFIQAGSRAATLIAVPMVLMCILCQKEKRAILPLLGSLAAGIAISILAAKTGSSSVTSHLSEMSVSASTFLGRLLYWRDALPVCLKHPFGLGYLGYYFMQGSFQTGAYSVRWVHNDLLQLLLDVGWIPAALCVVAAWRALRCKNTSPMQKIVLLALLMHTLCDFDLEYIFMFLLVLLVLDWESGNAAPLKRSGVWIGFASLFAIVSIWMGISSAMTTLRRDAAAVRIYPWNTFSQLRLLAEDIDTATFAARSEKIVGQNQYSAVAWNAQAIIACRQGNISEMVYAKRKAIACNKYDLLEYTDYIDKLLDGAKRYEQAGQHENAQLCIEEAMHVPQYLSSVRKKTSALAWKIADTPQLELPQEYMNKLALQKS